MKHIDIQWLMDVVYIYRHACFITLKQDAFFRLPISLSQWVFGSCIYFFHSFPTAVYDGKDTYI